MLEFENQNIEFKQEYVPDIRKDIGFENAEGGIVHVGVRKDGAVLVIGNRWCSNHGRCCIPRYQFCHSAGIEKTVKSQKKSSTHQTLSKGCPKTTTAKYIDRSIGELSY